MVTSCVTVETAVQDHSQESVLGQSTDLLPTAPVLHAFVRVRLSLCHSITRADVGGHHRCQDTEHFCPTGPSCCLLRATATSPPFQATATPSSVVGPFENVVQVESSVHTTDTPHPAL